MLFNKKDKQEKPKYEAIYKSLHSGKTRACVVAEPTDAIVNFLYENEGVWEMYMLICVTPLDAAEQ